MGNHRPSDAAEEANPPTEVEQAPNLRWYLVSTQERMQLVRLAERLTALLHRVLALQAMAQGRRD